MISELERERRRAAWDIDARVAAESDCEECGHHGLTYRAEYRDGFGGRKVYVAVARCPSCHSETEF